MAKVRIPPYRRAAVGQVASLAPADLDRLVTALQAVQPDAVPENLARSVRSQLPDDFPLETLEEIVGLLIELESVRSSAGIPMARLIQDVSESDEIVTASIDTAQLASGLEKLLASESVHLTSKARRLAYDDERSIHTIAIRTDLRPVFREDVGSGPVAFVVRQLLKVTYHSATGLGEFYVSLDPADLEDLEKQVERAKDKAQSLSQYLEAASTQVIDRVNQ